MNRSKGSSSLSDQPSLRVVNGTPLLRRDLIITPRTDRHGKAWFLIEDPVRHAFHRLGLLEYELLLALGSSRSIDDARRHVESLHPGSSTLTARQASTLLHFAEEHQLFASADAPSIAEQANPRLSRRWNQWTLFDRRTDWRWIACLSGLFTKTAAGLLIAVSLLALATLSADWARFSLDAKQVLHPDRVWIIACVWLLLKIVHELGHLTAAVCFGCRPGKVGFTWMLLAPVAFVDLSDLHRLASRNQRLAAYGGGVYFEAILAMVALLLWCSGQFPAIDHWLVSLAIAASASTILFNFNPLLRLDGYYIFAELLSRPQLSSESQRQLLVWAKRLFLGQAHPDAVTESLLLLYGLSSYLYRFTLMIGLVYAAQTMYGDWAAMTMIGVIAAIMSVQLARATRWFVQAANARPAIYLRFALLFGLLISPIALGTHRFWNRVNPCYAVVEFAADAPVRAHCDGTLIRLLVVDEQWVIAGQSLVELENLPLVAKIRQAEQELVISETKLLRLRQSKRPAEEAAEHETLNALRQQVESLQKQQAGLTITAPCDGMVLLGATDQRLGAWFVEGDELLRVVDPQRKRIVAAIPPQVAVEFNEGSKVAIKANRFWSESINGQVAQIASRASTTMPHPALSAKAGGPLSVYDTIDSSGAQATVPYVSAEIELSDPLNELRPGQTVWVRSLGVR